MTRLQLLLLSLRWKTRLLVSSAALELRADLLTSVVVLQLQFLCSSLVFYPPHPLFYSWDQADRRDIRKQLN